MLALLATAFLLGTVLLNLVALGLLGRRLVGHYALARAAAPVAAALALFFVEHFVGLGRLGWLWPLTTAASLWVVARRRDVVRAHWRVEAVFAAAFAWAFAWRWASPSIVASSEKIGDLAMIASYLPGTRLPPVDAWFPPFPFDVYYSFQAYAAALLGRVFGMGPGLTYNVAFCVAVALTVTSAAGAARLMARSTRAAVLLTAAFTLGGTGASLPAHAMFARPELYTSMRLIGDAATPAAPTATAFGRAVIARAGVGPDSTALRLPSETFAYLATLGDYHPPLSGFYLLALALLCVAVCESGAPARGAQGILAATVPLCAIANGWTFPPQAILVAAWVAYRHAARRPPDWRALLAGGVGALALCYPFLSTFAYRAADYGVTLRLVPAGAHTPPLLGALVLGPLLLALALPLASAPRRPWLLWSTALWAGLLVLSEVAFVDDVYSGVFERFNTTLKWWPWIQAGALLTGGAFGLGAPSRFVRWATAAVLAWVTAYGFDLGRALATTPAPYRGRLDGAGVIAADPIERVVYEHLRAQPRGIVLQRLQAGAFTPAPSLALLAGHAAFLGWPEHEKLWRGQRADVALRDDEVRRFYAGTLADPADWLAQNRVDHVLWLRTEGELPAGTFDAIDARLRGRYYWREFYRGGEMRVGMWSRR
ncbi:DUF2298 domain-containing protein [Roseisolibacter sp. H3M3-2]|uniref:DUF2298 domain-containing protein n=1 Tax=Roseisolibacter sp. H3M3-2 TaxID=3031323 RepID=UPI0023DCEB9E|nr:DUF2298 domain-containing protein [Roseisolibacter sp. H3M3-2]MDF1503380.1 DUF2298 domain-containing protein [Roseisolibacter sp. H3M3-2]